MSMNWKTEWQKLLWIVIAFLACFFMPVGKRPALALLLAGPATVAAQYARDPSGHGHTENRRLRLPGHCDGDTMKP
jgi:hypothetical protein